MSETKSLQRIEPQQEQTSMLALIDRAARDPNVDVSKMERLLAMAEQVQARQSKAAYDDALNAAQGEMRPISRDCHNPQTRSRYASYEQIDNAIRLIYTSHGFAMSFGSRATTTPDRVIVTCRISHRGGHTEHVELEMPADGKGAKGGDVQTKTHATGSALSYGKRYIVNLVWNLSFGESDDDGNAASPREPRQNYPQRGSGRDFVARDHSEPAQPFKTPPAANVERKQATPEAVLPAVATEKYRTRTIERLMEVYSEADLGEYAKAHGIQNVNEWPLGDIPTSPVGFDKLSKAIGQWLAGGEPPAEEAPAADALPAAIANHPVHIPPKNVKRSDYTPQTIGELYEAAKAGDEDAKHRLFGFVSNFQPKPWKSPTTGKENPPSQADFDLRVKLDQFAAWRESREPKQGEFDVPTP